MPHDPTGAPGRVATLRDALTVLPRDRPLHMRLALVSARVVLWAALRSGFRLRVTGVRHHGPAVVVSNHPHVIDGLVVLFADPAMRPVARWHRVALLRVGMRVADSIITTTDARPAQPWRPAFAEGLAHVCAGGRVWIAPEGGWQPETTLRAPRTGAVRMATMAGVPLQVLAISHDVHPGPALATWRPWHRPRITMHWGPVVEPTGVLDADIDRMMTAIADSTGGTWTAPEPADGDPPVRT